MKINVFCLALLLPAVAVQAVELSVVPQNGMPLVTAAVDGVACTLLVDTGASHTTLDLGFVTNALKGATLHEVELVGRTNVAMMPKFVETRQLTVGEATFETEGLMALDLAHLHRAVGRRVDGILGMNHLRTKPCVLSLGRGELVWEPSAEARAGFRPLTVRDCGTTFKVLTKTPTEKPVALLVDTGSTFTFVDETLWPAAEGELKMGTADVNVRREQSFRRGKSAEVACGPDVRLTLQPVLTPEKNRNQLGNDILKSQDLLIEPNGLKLKPSSTSDLRH